MERADRKRRRTELEGVDGFWGDISGEGLSSELRGQSHCA